MRVMLPIEESGRIARGFHNASRVCIYDSYKECTEWKNVSDISLKPGEFSKDLVKTGVDSVISGYLPPMVLQLFTRCGLEVFKARGNDVEENISFFINKQLEEFTSETSRQMWGCNSGCGSCNSKSCA